MKITTTVIKLSLRYYAMSEGNTCIAKPDREVVPLHKPLKD